MKNAVSHLKDERGILTHVVLCFLMVVVLVAGTPWPGRPATLSPPVVPATGAYLGGWVNPMGLPSNGGANEIAQLPRFTGYIGRKLSILHIFILFTDNFPLPGMISVQQYGAYPMLDWGCEDIDKINSGQDDAIITNMARSVKLYGQPMYLRWYWEMNYNNPNQVSCHGYDHPANFVAAWQHIWGIFQQVGATNAAFVWCPLSAGVNTSYYPGDGYVDWIGVDAFDTSNSGAEAYKNQFNTFYQQWSGNKPMLIGATGARPSDQNQYIKAIETLTPTLFPNIKAVLYFDAPGTNFNYSLTGNGFTAFRALARNPYFIVH